MTADEARDCFSAAYDGELDEAQQAEFEAALQQDPELASDYAGFRLALLGLAGPTAPGTGAPIPDLLPGVQERLRARSRGRFYADRFAERRGRGSYTLVLVMLILALLMGMLWFSSEFMDRLMFEVGPGGMHR